MITLPSFVIYCSSGSDGFFMHMEDMMEGGRQIKRHG